jgi:hypothetical protein
MDKKNELLKQQAAARAKVAELTTRRGELAAELAEARQVFESERGGAVRALLARMTHNPAKLADARNKLDTIPAALAALDRELIEVQAPLAGIERALLRLEADEIPTAAEALYRKLAAVIAGAQPDYQALCALAERQYELRREHGIQPDPYQRSARDFMLLVSGIGLAAERLADVESVVSLRLKMLKSLPV